MRAPATTEPLSALRPTPPVPKTATVLPGSTFAVRSAAPKPVVTPQPISEARSSGMSSRIFTSPFLCNSMYSAWLPTRACWCRPTPSRESRGGSLAPRSGFISQRLERPVRQSTHSPQ